MTQEESKSQPEVHQDEPSIVVSKGKRSVYFLILYGLLVINFIARVGINPIFPVIQKDLGLSDSEVGLLGGAVLIAMSLFVLPVSYLGEKKSTKKAINISALLWTIGTAISGMAAHFVTLLGARFFVGVGNAGYSPLSNSLLTNLYPKKDWGKKIGLYNTAMTLGGALGAIIFAGITQSFGWRVAFYAVAAVSLLLTLTALYLPDPQKLLAGKNAQAEKKVDLKEACNYIVKNKSLLFMCLGAGIGLMSLNAASTYFSIYCVRYLNMSVNESAYILGGMAIISALAFPIGGYILDALYKKSKKSRVLWPVVTFALTGILYVVAYQFSSLIALLLAQFAYILGGTSFHVAAQELVPSRYKSVSYGIYVLFTQFLGALGPIAAGGLSDMTNLVVSLSWMQVSCLCACVLLVVSSMSYQKYYDLARTDD